MKRKSSATPTGARAPWRDFELLVARIERLAAEHGAIVQSPDRLFDILTGGDREVDASIRQTVGSVKVLITVECRKRLEVQDVTWIEQLATKRRSVGAAYTIAVSSSGFTKQAAALAARDNILLRSLSTLTDSDIERLLVPIIRVVPHFDILGVRFYLADSSTCGIRDLHPDLVNAIEQTGAFAKILQHASSTATFSLDELFRISTEPTRTRLYDNIPENEKRTKIVECVVSDGDLRIRTAAGVRDLTAVHLKVLLYQVRETVPPKIAVNYRIDGGGGAIRHAQYIIPDIDPSRDAVRLSMQVSDDEVPAIAVELGTDATGFRPARTVHLRSGRIDESGRFVESNALPPRNDIRFVDL